MTKLDCIDDCTVLNMGWNSDKSDRGSDRSSDRSDRGYDRAQHKESELSGEIKDLYNSNIIFDTGEAG